MDNRYLIASVQDLISLQNVISLEVLYMAYAGAHAATLHTSSYRVKFRRQEFLDLVETAQPQIIYRSGRIHFFAYDGFVMYTFDCNNEEFRVKVFTAIEFSNTEWAE